MVDLSLSQFADAVSEIMPVISHAYFRRQESELSRGKITVPQFVVLEFLHKSGECTMSDLAAAINVTTAAITGITDRLVRCGYVSRRHGRDDRRVVIAALTAKGSKTVSVLIEERKNMIEHMFGKLSQEERDSYLNILMKIKDIILSEN